MVSGYAEGKYYTMSLCTCQAAVRDRQPQHADKIYIVKRAINVFSVI